jgi:hypothetical protein
MTHQLIHPKQSRSQQNWMHRHQFSRYWVIPTSLFPHHQDDFCLFGRWACTAPSGLIYCMDCRCRQIVSVDVQRYHISPVVTIPDQYTAQYLACDDDEFLWLELTSIQSNQDNYFVRVNPYHPIIEFKFNISEHYRRTHQSIMDLFNDCTHRLWVTVDESLCQYDSNQLIPVKTCPSSSMIYYRLRTGHLLIGSYAETFQMTSDPYTISLLSPEGREIFTRRQNPDMCLSIKIMEVPRTDDIVEMYLITTSYPGYNGDQCQLHRLILTPLNQVQWETLIPQIQPRIRSCDYLPAYRALVGFRQHEVLLCPVTDNYIPSLKELCLNRVDQLHLPHDQLTQDLQDLLKLRQIDYAEN